MEEIKSKILEEYKQGNIILMTFDGLKVGKLEDFIKQPTELMLYDLNRDEATVLTFINDPKWVNDYAVSKVIKALKNRVEELEGKLRWIPISEQLPPKKKKTRQVFVKNANSHKLDWMIVSKYNDCYLDDIEVIKKEFTHWREIEL